MRRTLAIVTTVALVTLGTIATTSLGGSAADFTGQVDAAGKSWSPHSLSVNVGDTIDASLDWTTTTADLNLFLRDPSNTAVAISARTNQRPETVHWVATVAGTYTIGVKAKTGASDYTMHVDVTPAPTSEGRIGTDWPMFHFDARHHGVTPDTDISTDTVGQLGVDWQANVGAKAFTSPAVVYRPALDKTLVYVGRQNGEILAFDAKTGARVWSFVLTTHVQSSPAVVDGIVYIGTSDHELYALDADTGAVRCSYTSPGVFSASPVVADVDGTGLTVFLGENGITGGDDGGHFWAIHAVDPDDGFADCSLRWSYDAFGEPAGVNTGHSGSWSSPALGTDVNGRPIVVFGGSSPDNAVYALDARTGTRIWRYQTQVYTIDNDVGAGPTISAPGVNGFADGVVYIVGKNRIVHALNLRTGALIWSFSIRADSSSASTATVSTAALYGRELLVGYGEGLYRLDAVTGAKVWKSGDVAPTQMVYSSPAVTGPAGKEVVFSTDAAGKVLAHSLATGAILWSYQTGDFLYGSPVVVGDHVFVAGIDTFLYSFRLGASLSGRPDTTIAAPTEGQNFVNTGAPIVVSGTATDDAGVASVRVAVKNRNTNKWWDGTAWVKGFTENQATLGAPGGASTGWMFLLPPPATGGPFYVQAAAVDTNAQQDALVAAVKFSVDPAGSPPDTTIDDPLFREVFHFGAVRESFPVTIAGTATDLGGANPGIKKVRIVIKNREHEEYFCGFSGCSSSDHGGEAWTPVYKVIDATLSNPGATTTGWTVTIPVYDHPHSYSIVAWAMDKDNEQDQSRANVWRFCVRDPGDNTCA